MKKGDFGKLVQNLPEYMQQSLEFVCKGFDENRRKEFPVCNLGGVEICCNHYDSYKQAKNIWDERKRRINYDNILVKMQIDTEEELEQFEKIPYKKIGFSSIQADRIDVLDCSNIGMKKYVQDAYKERFWEFVNWQAFSNKADLRHYDVFKLLLGEEDYKRVELL